MLRAQTHSLQNNLISVSTLIYVCSFRSLVRRDHLSVRTRFCCIQLSLATDPAKYIVLGTNSMARLPPLVPIAITDVEMKCGRDDRLVCTWQGPNRLCAAS